MSDDDSFWNRCRTGRVLYERRHVGWQESILITCAQSFITAIGPEPSHSTQLLRSIRESRISERSVNHSRKTEIGVRVCITRHGVKACQRAAEARDMSATCRLKCD